MPLWCYPCCPSCLFDGGGRSFALSLLTAPARKSIARATEVARAMPWNGDELARGASLALIEDSGGYFLGLVCSSKLCDDG